MGPTARGFASGLLLLAGALPRLCCQGVGQREPLSRERLEALAPLARTWLLPPEGLPGGPSSERPGLEGLLARRVRREPLRPALQGEGRTYDLHVRLAPEGAEVRIQAEDTLALATGWARGPGALRMLFWKEADARRPQDYLPWRARLAEGLPVPDLGDREALILDGDGDGLFASMGKDVLFIEGTGWPPFPLTEVVLFSTGAYLLKVDPGDRIRVQPFQGPLGVLRPSPQLGENPGLLELVAGTGRVFRVLGAREEQGPVTPGLWHLLEARLACGLVARKELPPGGLGGAPVQAGQETLLQFGAPLALDATVKDHGDTLLLVELKISGSGGEAYFPDASSAFQGEPLALVVDVLVGRPGKERSRLTRAWSPWKISREEGVRFQPLELRAPGNWSPLALALAVRGGPLGGAQGSRKVR